MKKDLDFKQLENEDQKCFTRLQEKIDKFQ